MISSGDDVFDWSKTWATEKGLRLWSAEITSSTNSIAKDDDDPSRIPRLTDLGQSIAGPSLYLAREQTQGRGRRNHVWETPVRGALLSSWSFAMARVPQPALSPLVGLALYQAALRTWPELSFNLKAPNDLFSGNKKVAGLLIETVDFGQSRRTIVGLGLNTFEHPASVETATSLREEIGHPMTHAEWRSFLEDWLVGLSRVMVAGQRSELTPEARLRLRDALNAHPLLKEPILEVDEIGQLHSKSGVVRWHEL